MFKLTDVPEKFKQSYIDEFSFTLYLPAAYRNLGPRGNYFKVYCPAINYLVPPSIFSGYEPGGLPLKDLSLIWGSIDGYRLAVMKKEWLRDKYKTYYKQGDGEWFVTTCLINGLQKDYAVALRTALLRALNLPRNGDRPIEEVQGEWKETWNADAVHQEAMDIVAGRSPKGVEIRYVCQTHPNWWLPIQGQGAVPAETDALGVVGMGTALDSPTALLISQLVLEGRDLMRQKKNKEAVQHFQVLLNSYSHSAEVLYGHACALRAYAETLVPQEQTWLLQKARSVLRKVIEIDALHGNVLADLAAVEAQITKLTGPCAITLTTFGAKKVILGEELGRGGYGVVYKARCEGQTVAVKCFALPALDGPQLQEFLAEATMMINLNHPHLLSCTDLVAMPYRYCLVMDYMPKGSLYDVLHRSALPSVHPLRLCQQFQIIKDISRGLSALHDHSIIHRDLKSLNILIGANDRAKVADFGLAKIKTDVATSKDSEKKLVGTLLWLAPEIVRGETGHTRASDIYSFGLIVWEIASRLVPYEGKNVTTVFREKTNDTHENLSVVSHKGLSRLIQICWSVPLDRPTAKDLVQVLKNCTVPHP